MAKNAQTEAKASQDVTAPHDPETGELVATPAQTTPTITAGSGDEFDLDTADATTISPLRQVTLPVLKFADGKRIFFKAISKIELGTELTQGTRGRPKMEPAEIMKVQGPQGALRVLICGKVLASELRDNYPNDSYVGRWFAAQKFAPIGEKQYATYHIIEIADPTAPRAPAAIAT